MSSSSSTASGKYLPPLLEVTSDDHRAWIAIATALGLSCSLVTLMIRIFVRIMISPPFGHDDTAFGAATVVAIIQSSVVFHAVSKGLGLSASLVGPADMIAVEQATYGSDILYLITAYITKCSTIFLLLRLTSGKRHRRAFKATLVASTVWVVASIFAIALRCDLSRPWIVFNQKCDGLLLRWQIIGTCDIVTEVAIFSMSLYLVYGLHMASINKVVVVGSFGFRLAVVPFLITRLVSFPRHHFSSDPTFTLAHFSIWTQTTLNVALMATTIPCLKPFVAGLSTGYGAFDADHVASQSYGYGMDSRYLSRDRSGALLSKDSNGRIPSKNRQGASKASSRGKHNHHHSHNNIDNDRNSKDMMTSNNGREKVAPVPPTSLHTHPDQATTIAGTTMAGGEVAGPQNQTQIVAQDGNSSIKSNDSRQMIIRKDVDFDVQFSTT